MVTVGLWALAFAAGLGLMIWGSDAFAKHLGRASALLGVSALALALLLAGAEPEELATVVTAALRGAAPIAFGDVIGANVTMCCAALGLGALIAPLPVRGMVLRYGGMSVPLGALAAWLSWDGRLGRPQGLLLVGLYAVYVAMIWRLERRPPLLGQAGEGVGSGEVTDTVIGASHPRSRPGTLEPVLLVGAGLIAIIAGASLLVAAVQAFAVGARLPVELGLTLVGFATGFDLVVLAWSAARRGASEATIAAVVGSFAYNVTMSLGAGALARPLRLQRPADLHLPWLYMLGALVLVLGIGLTRGRITRLTGLGLLALYLLFAVLVFVLPA